MKRKHKISGPDVIVTVLCLTLIVMTLGAAGRQGHRRARQAVCLSNLRQWSHFTV